MAKLIGVVGFSGSGKTYSLRTLPPELTALISPYKTDLPFAGADKNYSLYSEENPEGNLARVANIKDIPGWVKYYASAGKKYIIIDDTTHGLTNYTLSDSFRNKAKTKDTWSRWEEFGADVYHSLIRMADELPNDIWVIIMFHPEQYASNLGERLKLRTPGSLLERSVDIPSYFTYMLYTKVDPFDKDNPKTPAERYWFVTNDDGYSPAKTPSEAFGDEMYIPNDMMFVIDSITAHRQGMTYEEYTAKAENTDSK